MAPRLAKLTESDLDDLVAEISIARFGLGLGFRTAARAIGISPTTLQRIEKGSVPTAFVLSKVQKWLGRMAEDGSGRETET